MRLIQRDPFVALCLECFVVRMFIGLCVGLCSQNFSKGIVQHPPVQNSEYHCRGNPIVVASLPSSHHPKPKVFKLNVASMCYPGEAPLRKQDRAVALIEDDLTSLTNTGDHLPENRPPNFLEFNSAVIDLPAAEADALRRLQIESLLPVNSGVSTYQRPSRALKEGLQDYFFYIASPQVRDRKTEDIWPPPDALLRRLLRSLPPRLTFTSWVSKMLISHAKRTYGIGGQFYITDECKEILINPWAPSHPRHQRMKSDLEVLPRFLTHLAVKFAEWLPFELQMLDDEETPEEARLAFRDWDTEYLPGRHTPREPGDDFFLYVVHSIDFLQTRGWFDLPFETDVEGRFHDSLDRYRYAPGQ